MKKIPAEMLVDMGAFAPETGLRIELAYAGADNLLFGERIYRSDAKLWLHRDLAVIISEAALECRKTHGLSFILYDGLRTMDAQRAMLATARVKANPQWLEAPRLLSPPGKGGHPRGMAVDLSVLDENGQPLDMGTPFDFLAASPLAEFNAAHRDHPNLPASVMRNRALLHDCLMRAAARLETPLMGLPQEWWDYRLPPEIYEQYEPLSDADLPPEMRMVFSGADIIAPEPRP